MTRINIPPAALEAGARAIAESLRTARLTLESEDGYKPEARAAFEAMVKNWDGAFKNRSGDYVMFHLSDALILPVPMESLNDKP